MKIHVENILKTCISTRYHHQQFLVKYFGLNNALARFMDLINRMYGPYLDYIIILFIADILAYSRIKEEHAQYLKFVIKTLRDYMLFSMTISLNFVLSQ